MRGRYKVDVEEEKRFKKDFQALWQLRHKLALKGVQLNKGTEASS